jgi:hypothetical protein
MILSAAHASTSTSITNLELVTLVIAIIGALTGVASLAWSIASHLLSGARVTVELEAGWVGPAGMIHGPIESFNPHTPPMDGMREPVICVQVRNKGRLQTSVTGYSVKVGRTNYFVPAHPANPALPFILGVGESAIWMADHAGVVAAVHAHREVLGQILEIRGQVDLGDGRTIVSENRATPAQIGA